MSQYSDLFSGESQRHFFLTLEKPGKLKSSAEVILPPRLRSRCCGPLLHIASGSVSDVYEIQYQGIPAALKVIHCGLDLNRMHHALRECSMLRLVDGCPGTVPLLEQDVYRSADGFSVFLLQEYRMPLEEYCLQHPMTVHRALHITLDICTAMKQCWEAGVAHLDIQPGNLFVDSDGTAQLGDFSSALPVEELDTLRHLRGTPAYMAPEVYRSFQYSQASEIYSLGLVFYSLLCGGSLPFAQSASLDTAARRRFSGEPFCLPQGFHPKLQAFLENACAFDPRSRFSSLGQMGDALKELLRSCPDSILPAPAEEGKSAMTQSSDWLCDTPFPMIGADEYGEWATSRVPPPYARMDTSALPRPRDPWGESGALVPSFPGDTIPPGTTFREDELAWSVALTADTVEPGPV